MLAYPLTTGLGVEGDLVVVGIDVSGHLVIQHLMLQAFSPPDG
jgi:hypothetical protein